MKKLIVFYSRTGVTRRIAELLTQKLQCDMEEIIDTKDRKGAMGYLMAGRDATLKNLTILQPIKQDPSHYDLVIIGTPIWAWTMVPAIRTYLTEQKGKFRQVAFFCTQGGSGAEKTFKELEDICGIKPVAVLQLKTKEVLKGNIEKDIEDFIRKISNYNIS